ncbi:MAG: hypothetical protein N2738_08280 [Thermodesulfovibrionales bacterium]|nr:hypothetical protein [Thermodesulfovibrionales bacterium]
MKFIVTKKNVSLTDTKKPCEEAREEALTALDYRTVSSLKEAESKIWFKDWYNGGENHREENGMIVCEKKEKVHKWIVEFNSLEELINFQSKYGDILISDSSPFVGVSKEIKLLGV